MTSEKQIAANRRNAKRLSELYRDTEKTENKPISSQLHRSPRVTRKSLSVFVHLSAACATQDGHARLLS